MFSLCSVVFRADIAVAAFPLALVFTGAAGWFACKSLLADGKAAVLPAVRKLFQYLPFALLAAFVLRRAGEKGTPFWLDAVSVALWLVAFVTSLLALYYLNDKRVFARNPALAASRPVDYGKRPAGAARVVYEAVGWIDALVQAVFMVTLIHLFIVQLYEIPSESMVPEFLIRDRVVVFKTPSGSRFPLSDVGLPRFRGYNRGDIVVFRNPHYSQERKSEVKTFVSQLVFMITFTAVNLNTDDEGNLKADPLVKRVTGLPGEQLMMQDGVLYARRSGERAFAPVADDVRWAEWNVAGLPSNLKNAVRSVPLSQAQYDSMAACEAERNALSFARSRTEAQSLARRFTELRGQIAAASQGAPADPAAYRTLIPQADMFEYSLFRNNDALTWKLLSAEGGDVWFNDFMTSWLAAVPEDFFSGAHPAPDASREDALMGGSLYADAGFRLNLMVKLALGGLVVRNAEFYAERRSASTWSADPALQELYVKAEMLNNYVFLLDRRNMPVFPANGPDGSPQYIPENQFFMMGDNRFNSLDMRHSYEDTFAPLSSLDPLPVMYYTNMAPQSVAAKSILGTPVLRVWPVKRFGVPGLTGKE
ncbi:MAG: signal peptidase I [Treponema sp.]|nr:signal peptidase I [Treponema sp.]